MAYTVRYVGESLTSLVTHEVRAATDRLQDDIARRAQLTLYDTAREATPSRSGKTRDSWLAMPTRHEDGRREARVSNDDDVAFWLNYGTEAHSIAPKDKRAVETPLGPRADAHVAGIEPHHMVEHAAEAVARTIAETSLPARERWRQEVEAIIDLNKKRLQ